METLIYISPLYFYLSIFFKREETHMKHLIIIDMQNDFVTGSLGTDEAKSIVKKVTEKFYHYD